MFLMAAKTTRLGRPADLAAITPFLLSDEAEWINGQTWYIGGASHLRPVTWTRLRRTSVARSQPGIL